jgi:methylated-DNA-[protein]-cysteine S-methyltransferase
VLWEDDAPSRVRLGATKEDAGHPLLLQAQQQLEEYFAGKRRKFTVKLDPAGTEFQNKVWNALRTIPFGETRSYGEIANQIGSRKAVRAVGAANGRNPLSIIVPCHRVIGADGKLTGFAGGLEVKAQLLALEHA